MVKGIFLYATVKYVIEGKIRKYIANWSTELKEDLLSFVYSKVYFDFVDKILT